MKVFIYGIKGNMGQRYKSILEYLGHEVYGQDLGERKAEDLKACHAIIIASPTTQHMLHIHNLLIDQEQRPILCEKPFICDEDKFDDLQDLIADCEEEKMKLSMVSQYDYLADRIAKGPTLYDYFKTGKDGLAWDCINIIWNAKGKIKLKNKSPEWHCILNGVELKIEEMDWAYVKMLQDWLKDPYVSQYKRIIKSHKKVLEYLDGKFD